MRTYDDIRQLKQVKEMITQLNNKLKRNKLKSATKNGTKVTLNFSSNIVGDSNDENNFLHKLSLTNPALKFWSFVKLLQTIPLLI